MADITLIDKHRTHVWKPKLREIAFPVRADCAACGSPIDRPKSLG